MVLKQLLQFHVGGKNPCPWTLFSDFTIHNIEKFLKIVKGQKGMSSMTVLIKNCTASDGVVLGVSCLLPLGAEQDQLPCGSTGTSSGNCQETETCMVRACRTHSTTASPKPSFRATWRVGNAVVGRGDAGRISSNSADPSPCQSCSQGPLTLEEDFC